MDEAVGVALEAVEVLRPDALAVLVAEGLVVQSDVDTAEEGAVKGLDAVGGQEEHATVVFEGAEEDGDEAVAGNVLGATALKVDIGLIQKDESSISLSQLEEVAEVCLDVVRINTEVSACQGDEGSAGELGNTLSRASLADTRATVEKEDSSLSLVLDEVVSPRGDLALAEIGGELADQSLDGELDFVVEDEVLERVLVSLEGLEVLEAQVTPATITENEAGNGVTADEIEQVALRGNVVEGIEVLEAKIWAVVVGRTILGTLLASTEGLVSGEVVLDWRRDLVMGPVIPSTAHTIWAHVVECVETGSVADDAATHETRRTTGRSVTRARVDQ